MARWHKHTVTVVMTVKNDPIGCAVTLSSLTAQTRMPEEIIIVDGGSTDDTVRLINQYMVSMPQLRLIEAPGANIARGRNLGVEDARGEIIITTDAGCRADANWVEQLLRPFQEDGRTEFVAGFYKVEPHTLFEQVVGLATMRGQLDPVSPDTFNPSARSLAMTKTLWQRAEGWPEWINFSEDTLFDHKVRRLNVGWRFAGDAVVHWRPRSSLRSLARQFYNYGTGRGHTRIDAAGYIYNIRNASIMLLTAGLTFVTLWALPLVLALFAYFYVWAFHHQAVRIARRTRKTAAYPLCLGITWVIVASGTAGFLVGSWQRWRDRKRYQYRMEAYLAQPKWVDSDSSASDHSRSSVQHRLA